MLPCSRVAITRSPRSPKVRHAALLIVTLALAGCGASTAAGGSTGSGTHARPHAVEPTAGQAPVAAVTDSSNPVGDPNAHAPPLSEVKKLLQQELVAAPPTSAGYVNPLHYVNIWGRTDQLWPASSLSSNVPPRRPTRRLRGVSGSGAIA